MDITVTLRPAELKALVRQADEERRSPVDHASYLLARALCTKGPQRSESLNEDSSSELSMATREPQFAA